MRETLIKPYQVKEIDPDVILIGNSVVNSGFDLSDPLLSKERTYSMGIAGIGIYANYRTIQNVDKSKDIIWLLDFWNFLGSNESNSEKFIESSDFGNRLPIDRNGKKNAGHYLQSVRDFGLVLFSWEAIAESIYTITTQDKKGWHLLQNGSWGGSPDHSGKSQKKYFRYMEKILLEDLQKSSGRNRIFHSLDGTNSLLSYESALRWIYQHNISTVLVIPPAHVRWYEVLFFSGYWTDYKEWKNEIVRINERLALEFHRNPLILWDFSGYTPYTMEPVSDMKGGSGKNNYFVDNVHFSHALGSLIIEAVKPDPTVLSLDRNKTSFGIRLDSGSVSSQLAGMEHQHRLYIENQAEQWQDIWQLCNYLFKDQPEKCLDPEQQRQRYGY